MPPQITSSASISNVASGIYFLPFITLRGLMPGVSCNWYSVYFRTEYTNCHTIKKIILKNTELSLILLYLLFYIQFICVTEKTLANPAFENHLIIAGHVLGSFSSVILR